ncbi:uncharacterized protein LOC110905114 [Helianthus annuus]|uniref:uncharacterized protein LOC110905114 n=1 Tax=Helianthus annuus TaxID=4232 RepID=UPI0016530DB5|nr:uncharacterized protein LOC110905114 [Helianthus annuus]
MFEPGGSECRKKTKPFKDSLCKNASESLDIYCLDADSTLFDAALLAAAAAFSHCENLDDKSCKSSIFSLRVSSKRPGGDVEKWIDVIRIGLEGITVNDANKSFNGVCSRLEDMLDSLSTLLSENSVLNKDELLQLAFAAIQLVNSVFCSMNQNQKEQSRHIMSRSSSFSIAILNVFVLYCCMSLLSKRVRVSFRLNPPTRLAKRVRFGSTWSGWRLTRLTHFCNIIFLQYVLCYKLNLMCILCYSYNLKIEIDISFYDFNLLKPVVDKKLLRGRATTWAYLAYMFVLKHIPQTKFPVLCTP